MFTDIPGFIILDVSVFIFLIIGGLIGYYRGAARALVSLIGFYIPYLLYLHFSDQIADYVDLVIGLTGTSETSAIGLIGTFSGLMGGLALFLCFFLASRFLIKILLNHDPEIREKLWGAVIGVTGNQVMVMVSMMLVFMALPAATAGITSYSLWWKVTKPAARSVYPTYRDLIGNRTENLRAGIAKDGLIKGVMSGGINVDEQIGMFITTGSENAEFLASGLSEEFLTSMETFDLDALQALIEPLAEDGVSAEDIDRRIREEDARRRQMLDGTTQMETPKTE